MTNTNKFFKVPTSFFNTVLDNDLSGSEALTLLAITAMADNDENVCFASNDHLGVLSNLTGNRVSRLVTSLKKKKTIEVKQYRKGTNIQINGVSYLAYRLIKPTYQNNYTQVKTTVKNNNTQNKTVVNMDNNPLVEMNNNPLLESTTNHTKKNNTKRNNTKSLSKTNSVNTNRVVQNDDSKNNQVRDDKSNSKYKDLFDYALEKAKERKAKGSMIANVKAYARVMAKNWIKQGLTTPEMVEENMSKVGYRYQSRYTEKMPSWYVQNDNSKGQIKSNNIDKQSTMADIERLKAKLGCN